MLLYEERAIYHSVGVTTLGAFPPNGLGIFKEQNFPPGTKGLSWLVAVYVSTTAKCPGVVMHIQLQTFSFLCI